MCYYYIFFGFLSIAMVGFLYPFICSNTDWNPYAVWVAALTLATLAMYGLDKGLSKTIGKVRTPEIILHLLAILGGFPGGWLGMMAFNHKTNICEHPGIWAFLTLGTVIHIFYYWLFVSR